MGQDRRVVRTKGALTKALFELLGEKEFSKISVTELARRAEVDRKTFYLHYQSVDEILEEFYEDALGRLETILEQENVFGQTVDVPGFFRALNTVIAENLPLYRRLAMGAGYTYFVEKLRALLRRATEDTLRRKGGRSEAEIRLYGEFYAAGVMRAYFAWLKGEVELTEEALTELVSRAVTQGLAL